MNKVLNGQNSELAERLLDDGVRRERHALLVDLSVSALVDELANGRQRDLTVRDVRLDTQEHLRGRLGDLDKDTVVDLEETEELQDLARLRGNVVDTVADGSIVPSEGCRNAMTTHPLMRMTK